MKLRDVNLQYPQVAWMKTSVSLCLLTLVQLASANPSGGEVSQGSANISYGQHTIIQQQSQQAVINWSDFSIGANEHTQFVVPNAQSITLNRVTTSQPSVILGRLSSNGQVYLINPNGILFGRTAQVDVGGLVASTSNITDNHFMNGQFIFDGPSVSGAKIENLGNISTIQDHGLVALVAPQVINEGVIQANLGKVVIGAGDRWTLDLYGDNLITFTVPADSEKQLYRVDQKGDVIANGGTVLITAQAADDMLESIINMDGYIEAKTVNQTQGNVVVLGHEQSIVRIAGNINVDAQSQGNAGRVYIMSDNQTVFSGMISAQGGVLGGNGGNVETSSHRNLVLNGGQVNTLAPLGISGNWLLDPDYFELNAISGAAIATSLLTNATVTVLANIDLSIAAGYQFTWSNGNALTLAAGNDINFGAGSLISQTGTGNLNLRADYDANGFGTVNFGAGSGVNYLSSTGTVNLFYNPTAYINPTNYTSFVQTNPGKFNAYMLVNSLSNLQAISSNLSGQYALGKNIAAGASALMNGGLGFDPIGDLANPFTGALNFAGYAISNLVINRPTEDLVGLFGATQDAKFSYIQMLDNSIIGKNLVGTFSGKLLRGTITGNSLFRSVVAGQDAVGIAYGSIQEVTINGNTVVYGNVTGRDYVGGVTGAAVNNLITGNIVHFGDTTGSNNVGGLVGTLTRNAMIVGLVFNSGNVVGLTNVGGIAGSVSGVDFNVNGTVGLGGVTGNVLSGGVGGGIIGSLSTNVNQDANQRFAEFFGSSGYGGLQRLVGRELTTNFNTVSSGQAFNTIPYTVEIDTSLYRQLGGADGILGYNRNDRLNAQFTSTAATDIFKDILTSDLIGGIFEQAFDQSGNFRPIQFTDSFISNITTAMSESNKRLSATGVMTMGAGVGGLLLSSRGGLLNDAFGKSLGANLLALFGMVSMGQDNQKMDAPVGTEAIAQAATSAWCGVTCRLVMLSVQSPTELPSFSDSIGVNPELYVNSSLRPNSEMEKRYTWDATQDRYVKTEAMNKPGMNTAPGIIKITTPL
jgi:filamentous hemagglutinin family protein